MTKLICDNCGKIMGVPSCCGTSMMYKQEQLLCCCSEECNHKPIPDCCGAKMRIMETH